MSPLVAPWTFMGHDVGSVADNFARPLNNVKENTKSQSRGTPVREKWVTRCCCASTQPYCGTPSRSRGGSAAQRPSSTNVNHKCGPIKWRVTFPGAKKKWSGQTTA